MSSTTNTNTSPRQPAAKVRHGNIHASVWRNHAPQGKLWYSTTVERTYKGKDGTWKPTSSFGRDELLVVAQVVTDAYARIQELQAEDRKAQTAQETVA